MKKLLLLFPVLIVYLHVQSQTCPLNIDFEEGKFTNWQCFKGTTFEKNGKNVIQLDTCQPIPSRHEIISADSDGRIPLDEYGKFPKLCPYGGKYSVKLGNENVGSEAEGMSYTFKVPSTEDTFTLTYYYAVVFQNPGHSPPEQPRFFVTAYETATKNPISCASYNYVSTGSIPGFKKSRNDVLYKEWSPVSIQFINLENKQVTIEFKTGDCTQGGHFGYAYFDVGSGCSNILATAPYCKETNSLLLNAPYGFQNYIWYNEDYTKVMGTDQNLTLTPPPVTKGKFWVDMIPYPGYGCRDTAYALVTPLPVPDTPSLKTNYFYCQNDNAPAFTGTPALNCYLLWYTDTTMPGSTEAIRPSTNAKGSFTYWVSQKLLFGCESFRKKITVQVDPLPVVSFTLNTYSACQKDNFFDCVSTSSNLEAPSYLWLMGNGDTLKAKDSIHYSYRDYGNFSITLKITNGPVCYTTATENIKVIPKPVAAFTYPAIVCQNETNLALQDQSSVPQQISQITQWNWQINNNPVIIQNPALVPTNAGDLSVSLVVSTAEGCVSDTLQKVITVHLQPHAQLAFGEELCENRLINFTDKSYFAATTNEQITVWNWLMDAVPLSSQNPAYLYTAGTHQTSLRVQSNFGCNSDLFSSPVIVYDKPTVNLGINDSCVFRVINYTAKDVAGNVNNWYWDFGKGLKEDKPALSKYFSTDGDNSFVLYSKTIHGCMDTIVRPFKIYMNRAYAGNDTLVAYNQPVQLNAHGGTDNHYTWSPSTGLNNASIEAPVAAVYDKDILYKLDAITNEGCDAHSHILIKRYNGPDIYIPTAFTPNSDRRNDILKAFPVGMKQLDYFAVYNRYGQRLFYTTDFEKGWDGNINGLQSKPDTYVAVAHAIDYSGKPMLKKVTVVLIR